MKGPQSRLREVVLPFLRLGFTAFGGPAAHLAVMERELGQKRAWLDREAFVDRLGLTQLIPSPNSTGMAIHLGKLRAGWPGLVLGRLALRTPWCPKSALGFALLPVAAATGSMSLFRSFPKIGSVLYGSGFVLQAFLRAEFVA